MQPALVTSPTGARLAFGYNGGGQLATETLQSTTGNRASTYTYNAAGDIETRTSPAGISAYTYDALGGLRQVVTANGKTITYDIDPSGSTHRQKCGWSTAMAHGVAKRIAPLGATQTRWQH